MAVSLIGLVELFLLLTGASFIYLASQRLKLPYTVLLVLFGSLLVPIALWTGTPLLQTLALSPELLFYVFLPVLLFESAYNMRIQDVIDNIRSIGLLAVVSLMISAGLIAGMLYGVFMLLGIQVPFIVFLLFGTLISSTDPVAVLALFKDFGAPKRLALIFEGESIFNDATAVALFFVILDIALTGFHGPSSLIHGGLTFLCMLTLGIVFGGLMGALTARALEYAKGNDFASITLSLVSAHLTFILAEIISHHAHIGDFELKISPIIATTIAAMFMGNYGRAKISPRAEEFTEKFWGQLAFIANSLVFILIGLLFIVLPVSFPSFIIPIIIGVVVVALARAASIYPVIGLLNWTKSERHIPLSWQHLLSWGSLRGALAITMVLLIPETYTPAGWTLDYSPRDLILALTVGCIYATLFIKATSMGWVIRKLRIDRPNHFEAIQKTFLEGLLLRRSLKRLDAFQSRGYISDDTYYYGSTKPAEALQEITKRLAAHTEGEQVRVVHQYLLGIERETLSELYSFHEISEAVYKRILLKLDLQNEAITHGTHLPVHGKFDRRDIFETLARLLRTMHGTNRNEDTESFTYYRTQKIIAEKVLASLPQFYNGYYEGLVAGPVLKALKDRYEKYIADLGSKIADIKTRLQNLPTLELRLTHAGLEKKSHDLVDSILVHKFYPPNIVVLAKRDADAVLYR